jgi:DNA-binding response OmpR family regulator
MSKWQILIVDDDPLLLRSLQIDLLNNGYGVSAAGSAAEALGKLDTIRPDLAVLDLIMPGMSGFDLAQQLRRHIELPIIMLTSIDDEKTVVEGLQRYADDYVIKPYRQSELRARIQKLLSRTYGDGLHPSQQIVVDDALTLDFGQHAVYVGGAKVNLTPIESRILFMLLQRAPEFVTSSALLRYAWGYGEEGDPTSLWVRIRTLRQKLEPNPDKPIYIQTVRGRGYAFSKSPRKR